MARSLPFTLVTAFSDKLTGGNPAAVVYLQNDIPTDDVLQAITRNLNQPIASYITKSLPTTEEHTAAFGIRWFALKQEVPLCGHGTIAAAKAIWSTPGMISDDVKTIEFHTTLGVVLKVQKGDGEWFEMQLPAGTVIAVDDAEKARIQGLVSEAIGREAHVNFVGTGGKGFEHMIMIELDEKDNLAGSKFDPSKLRNSGRDVNIITTASSNKDETFRIRMFAPQHIPGDGEDPVCGSAHCVAGPYWSKKLGIAAKGEMKSRQVSARGGDLKVVLDEEGGHIRLSGQLRVLGRGELLI